MWGSAVFSASNISWQKLSFRTFRTHFQLSFLAASCEGIVTACPVGRSGGSRPLFGAVVARFCLPAWVVTGCRGLHGTDTSPSCPPQAGFRDHARVSEEDVGICQRLFPEYQRLSGVGWGGVRQCGIMRCAVLCWVLCAVCCVAWCVCGGRGAGCCVVPTNVLQSTVPCGYSGCLGHAEEC